jgi:hypothetical protein
MQLRTPAHTQLCIELKKEFEAHQHIFDEEHKEFFKLFEESTFEGSQAAARKMKQIVKRYPKDFKENILLFHSLRILVRTSNSKKLSWPNSPLLVLLQEFVDPSVLYGLADDAPRVTPLHILADLADPSDISTHVNQVILAQQLIEHGAKVNAASIPLGKTPLHHACSGHNVTNLDFVQLLLEAGADPNCNDHNGLTPLIWSTLDAPGAAKFLLNWPTTDVGIISDGVDYLDFARIFIANFSAKVALSGNPEQVQDQFLLQQWHEIEEMLVERAAHT